MSRATEDQFLGALLGVAIGDALGLPVDGLSAREIRERHGRLSGYLPRPDAPDGQPAAGEISDKTEVLLCIVESLTTNDGVLDPVNINARLGFLLEGAARETMSEATVHGIGDAAHRDGLVSEEVVSEPELAVAVRGVAVGLLHAVGAQDGESIARDASVATRLTHGGEAASRLTARVAASTVAAARGDLDDASWQAADDPIAASIDRIVSQVRAAGTFEDAILPVVQEGGEASVRGAIAGGIAGARFGASGIPQDLIDELDARIYLSMAAPWFYRTALRRAGTVIDLRVINDDPLS